MPQNYERYQIILTESSSEFSVSGKKALGKCVMEARGEEGKVSFSVQNIRPGVICSAYIVTSDSVSSQAINIGRLIADDKGRAEVKWRCNAADVEGSGFSLGDFNVAGMMVLNGNMVSAPVIGHRDKEVAWKNNLRVHSKKLEETTEAAEDGAAAGDKARGPGEAEALSRPQKRQVTEQQAKAKQQEEETTQGEQPEAEQQEEAKQQTESISLQEQTRVSLPMPDAAGQEASAPMPNCSEPKFTASIPGRSESGISAPMPNCSEPEFTASIPGRSESGLSAPIPDSAGPGPAAESQESLKSQSPSELREPSESPEPFEPPKTEIVRNTTEAMPFQPNLALGSIILEKAAVPALSLPSPIEAEGFFETIEEGPAEKAFKDIAKKINEKLRDINSITPEIDCMAEPSPTTKSLSISDSENRCLQNIISKCTKIRPFKDSALADTWVKISPVELNALPAEFRQLHKDYLVSTAYKKFDHLILGYGAEGGFINMHIGVPDIYSKLSAESAHISGLTTFVCCDSGEVSEGKHGYWLKTARYKTEGISRNPTAKSEA